MSEKSAVLGRKAIKIISGGQTGADRGGLDFARLMGFEMGGYCPHGRRAEDGIIPDHYPLTPVASRDYHVRTRVNVRESDATVIFMPVSSPGSLQTAQLCVEMGKKHLILTDFSVKSLEIFKKWRDSAHIETLNVAGNRESVSPGIQAMVRNFLLEAWRIEYIIIEEAPERDVDRFWEKFGDQG